MARKTIDVGRIVAIVNTYNKASSDLMRQERMAHNTLLEQVLHETGNYRGFGYLNVDFTQDPPVIPDESRRVYISPF